MKEESYSKKLQNPLFQKKRLQIFSRDNWRCVVCGATDKQLELHHVEYYDGLKPWEYPGELLQTLCHDCHDQERHRLRHEDYLLQSLKSNGYTAYELLAIAEMLFSDYAFNEFVKARISTFVNNSLKQAA